MKNKMLTVLLYKHSSGHIFPLGASPSQQAVGQVGQGGEGPAEGEGRRPVKCRGVAGSPALWTGSTWSLPPLPLRRGPPLLLENGSFLETRVTPRWPKVSPELGRSGGVSIAAYLGRGDYRGGEGGCSLLALRVAGVCESWAPSTCSCGNGACPEAPGRARQQLLLP